MSPALYNASKPASQKPMPFLNLPTELRLEVYKHLVGPVTLTLEDNRLPKGVLKAYDIVCHMSILRTCKAIHNEAKPTMIDTLQSQKNIPTYHFFIYNWPAVESFIKINQVRFGLIDLISNPSFKQLAQRGSRRARNARFRIDYAKHPLTTDLGFQQDLAFLEVAARKVDSEINILHEGRLVPLSEHLTGESESLLSDYQRNTRRTWKMVFEHGAWIWDEPRIASHEDDPLLALIRTAGEPWTPLKAFGRMTSTKIGALVTFLTTFGWVLFCLFRLYHYFPTQRPSFTQLLYVLVLCVNVILGTSLVYTISGCIRFSQ